MEMGVDGVFRDTTPEEIAAFEATRPLLAPSRVESVSARQFKLQLLAAGMLDQVDAWVAS